MPADRYKAVRTLTCSTLLAFGSSALLAQPSQFSDAWIDYTLNPDAHPNIPNVSHAGYKGGGVSLPTAQGLTTIDATAFGATGDGVTDDTVAIRIAIDVAESQSAANPNGIVVLFPAGEYVLSGPLLVHSDNIHLRGEGEGQTILRFTQSLADSYAVYPGNDPGDSNWSFNGGLIWFTDDSRNPYYTGVPTITSVNTGFRFVQTINITQPATRGARAITVASTSALSPGQTVAIEIDNASDESTLRHLLGDGDWANNYTFTTATDNSILPANRSSFRVYHTIESINGNQITLREPTRFDLRSEWDPEVKTLQDLRMNVGVADMTIHLDRDYEWTRTGNHNKEPGFNGIAFTDTVDGFVDNVTVLNPGGLAIFHNYAKNVTIRNVTVDATSVDRARHHHAFGYANSADCLTTDFEIRSWPLHGAYVGNFSINNVYSRGVMHHGTFDYHKLMPYANVYTEIDIVNDGDSGGGSTSGPQMAARHVHWNIDSGRTSSRLIAQPDIMPLGALVGVQCTTHAQETGTGFGLPEAIIEHAAPGAPPPNPPNLYEAQLALRLAQQVPDQLTPPACFGCDPQTEYDFTFGGTPSASLVGQDNWIYERDFTNTDGQNVTLEPDATHPDGLVFVAQSSSGRDSIISRQNDDLFAFTPHLHTDTSAVIRFDARVGLPSGSGSGNAYLIVNNSSGRNEGIQFGLSASQFQIRGGQFNNTLHEVVSIPSGWYGRGDWARFELQIDFTANSGDGAATLSFQNLTDNDPALVPVPGLTNISLLGEVRYPETWDRIQFRIRNDAAVTNIAANADALIEPCCDADLDRDGELTSDDVRTFLVLVLTDHPAADLDADGQVSFRDALAYLKLYDEGCP